MQNIIKLVNDIFSMSFDVIIPVSGSIVAVITALFLFSIRYFTFRRKVKKYAGQPRQRRLTPRTRPLRQTSEGYSTLEAAKYCDKHIFLFFTDAVTSRGNVSDLDANGEMNRRFCAEMTSQLRSKAPPAEIEGAVD